MFKSNQNIYCKTIFFVISTKLTQKNVVCAVGEIVELGHSYDFAEQINRKFLTINALIVKKQFSCFLADLRDLRAIESELAISLFCQIVKLIALLETFKDNFFSQFCGDHF